MGITYLYTYAEIKICLGASFSMLQITKGISETLKIFLMKLQSTGYLKTSCDMPSAKDDNKLPKNKTSSSEKKVKLAPDKPYGGGHDRSEMLPLKMPCLVTTRPTSEGKYTENRSCGKLDGTGRNGLSHTVVPQHLGPSGQEQTL